MNTIRYPRLATRASLSAHAHRRDTACPRTVADEADADWRGFRRFYAGFCVLTGIVALLCGFFFGRAIVIAAASAGWM